MGGRCWKSNPVALNIYLSQPSLEVLWAIADFSCKVKFQVKVMKRCVSTVRKQEV